MLFSVIQTCLRQSLNKLSLTQVKTLIHVIIKGIVSWINKNIAECRSVTDSIGSHSDLSVHTIQASGSSSSIMARPHMDVVCVIDIVQPKNLQHRKKGLDEVRQACIQVGANLNHVEVNIMRECNFLASLRI